jgi:two-component system, LytTR family, sensor kinase
VENSIKHGIAKEARGGLIRVTACRSDGRLTLRVYNDGPGLPEDLQNTQSGIGIANLRSRLRAMFGDAFEVSLRNHAAGVEVVVSVPYRED